MILLLLPRMAAAQDVDSLVLRQNAIKEARALKSIY